MIAFDLLILGITGLVSLYPISRLVKYRDRKKDLINNTLIYLNYKFDHLIVRDNFFYLLKFNIYVYEIITHI